MVQSRTALLISAAVLTLAVLARAKVEPPGSPCPAQEAYGRRLSALPRACLRSVECAVPGLDWNPCNPAFAYNTGGADPALPAALRAERDKAHKACGFVMPPCAHQFAAPVCWRKTCRNLYGIVQGEARETSLRLVRKGKKTPLKNRSVFLRWAPGGPHDMLPEGPPRETRMRTDAAGLLVFRQPVEWNEAELEAEGCRPVKLSLAELVEKDGGTLALELRTVD